jgi:hypothetical protein
VFVLSSLNAELNLTCHLLILLGAHHILHVSGVRVNLRCDGFTLFCNVCVCVCVCGGGGFVICVFLWGL